MKNNNKDFAVTPENLQEWIMNYIAEIDESQKIDKGSLRLFNLKKRIINYLFNITTLKEFEGKQKEELISVLESTYSDNPELPFYIFFLSGNPQFDFEWSYLNKKYTEIAIFLEGFRRYIQFVCKDLTSIIEDLPQKKSYEFDIDQLIQVKVVMDGVRVSASIDLNNLTKVLKCKSEEYQLTVNVDNKKIGSFYRSSWDKDSSAIANNIKKLMNILF